MGFFQVVPKVVFPFTSITGGSYNFLRHSLKRVANIPSFPDNMYCALPIRVLLLYLIQLPGPTDREWTSGQVVTSCYTNRLSL